MKNKGSSTFITCSFKVKDDVYHVQKFQRHLKSSNHPKEQAWYCKNNNCKRRSFKLGVFERAVKTDPISDWKIKVII